MEPVYSPVIAFARTLFASQGLRFRVTGAENIPTSGGGVVAINHIGYLDFAFAGLAALPSRRVIRFMCKETVFDHPIAGPLMRGMKHIPVDREAGSASFRAALTALKAGELVGVFPEATISRSFELKEFKSGAVRMAQASRTPIIPLVVWGSQRVWTKGYPKRLGRTDTPIALTVGRPIEADRKTPVDVLESRLRSDMQLLLNHAQSEYPPMPESERHLLPARLGGTAPTLEQADALDGAEAAARREAKGL